MKSCANYVVWYTEKTTALRAAVFSLSLKNLRGTIKPLCRLGLTLRNMVIDAPAFNMSSCNNKWYSQPCWGSLRLMSFLPGQCKIRGLYLKIQGWCRRGYICNSNSKSRFFPSMQSSWSRTHFAVLLCHSCKPSLKDFFCQYASQLHFPVGSWCRSYFQNEFPWWLAWFWRIGENCTRPGRAIVDLASARW